MSNIFRVVLSVTVSFHTLPMALDEVAGAQRGLVTAAQLADLGVSRRMLRSLTGRGELVAVPGRRGLYRCAGSALDWETAVLAAVLLAGPAAVASHGTAARLWALVDRDRPAFRPGIHVVSPRLVRLDGVIAHHVLLDGRERDRRHGVPVTSAARTVLDLAGERDMTAAELGGIVDDGLRRGILNLRQLGALLDRRERRGRPRTATLRAVLADRKAGYQPGANDWEREMDRWWDASGLPEAARQHRVRARGRRYILDRAIVDLRVGVEWNGFGCHGDRSGMDRTSAKELDLASVGWIVLPVTTNTPPEAICRAVLGAVERAQLSERRSLSTRCWGTGS